MHVVIAHYAEPVPLGNGYVPTRYGELARVLESRGINATRIFPSFQHGQREQADCPVETEIPPFGTFRCIATRSYRQARSPSRLGFLGDYKLGVQTALADIKPEIALVAVPPPGLIRSIADLPGRPRVVADVRDLWPEAQIATLPSPLGAVLKGTEHRARRARERDVRHAARIMSLSETFLHSAVGDRHPAETAVFPLGCPPVIAERPLSMRRRGAVFVGSLSSHFNLSVLIEAWKMLARDHRAIYERHPLTIVGDGPLRRQLETESADLANVRMLGWQSHDEAMRLMEASAIGLAPYDSGAVISLPNKLFEYLAAGLPILSSLAGEMSAVVDKLKVGFWAPHDQPQIWVSRLVEMLEDEQMIERLGQRAKTAARGAFSRTTIAEGMADFVVGAGS